LIAVALRRADRGVEVHDDHLPIDAPDEEWIKLVEERGWIALTKDKNIRYRLAEFEAIKVHCARVVVIRTKNVTGTDLAALIVKHCQRIQRIAIRTNAPFVAGLDRNGKLSLYEL
jgi:predicted nuclease of predicted toxin-antitoxin system